MPISSAHFHGRSHSTLVSAAGTADRDPARFSLIRFNLVSYIWLAVIALAFGLLGFATGARAASLDCGTAFKSVEYKAAFEYSWNGKADPMAIRFGTTQTPQGPQHFAKIENSSKKGQAACQAVCSISRWNRVGQSAEPASAELQCSAPGFKALSQVLTVYWIHPKTDAPTLRIGKWLDGYEETPLKVALDRYSTHGAQDVIAQSLAAAR